MFLTYDAEADVLYVNLGRPWPAYAVEDQEIEGLHYRYALDTGELCGATVVWWSRQDHKKLRRRLQQMGLLPALARLDR